MGNVQLIEVIWVAEMTIGLGFSTWNVLDSYRDRKDIARLKDGLKEAATLTANGSMRTELIRTSQLVLLDAAGILALFQPSVETPHSAARTITLALLLVFGAALMTNTILTTRTRIKILKALGVRRGSGR